MPLQKKEEHKHLDHMLHSCNQHLWSVVLLAIVIIIGVIATLLWQVHELQEDQERLEKTLLHTDKKEAPQNAPPAIDDMPEEDTDQIIPFVNEEYGVEIAFPEAWSDMIMTESNATFGSSELTVPTFQFGFDVQPDLFTLTVFTQEEWEILKTLEGPSPIYLDENEDYVFAGSQAHYYEDGLAERWDEVREIFNSVTARQEY